MVTMVCPNGVMALLRASGCAAGTTGSKTEDTSAALRESEADDRATVAVNRCCFAS